MVKRRKGEEKCSIGNGRLVFLCDLKPRKDSRERLQIKKGYAFDYDDVSTYQNMDDGPALLFH